MGIKFQSTALQDYITVGETLTLFASLYDRQFPREELSGAYDTVIEKGLIQIELMQERRTALISAAVTGKIDVRSWHSPEIPRAAVHQTEEEL